MIIGIGNDLVDIRRIEKSLERFGPRFVARIFTAFEAEAARSRAMPAAFLAKRFAAKEACAKALGTGFAQGVFWRDIGVVNEVSGRPVLALSGGALALLHRLTPPGHTPSLHLSMSDEPPMAQAVVVISAVAKGHGQPCRTPL